MMKIGIIGGGASGMIAAVCAARRGASVTILEGGDRIGRKILATGNGKCNFTNQNMDNSCFRSNTIKDISGYLAQFGLEDTLDFFDSLQMLYKSKSGYYYPASEQAGTVLDALRYEIEALKEHIVVLTDKKVRGLTYQQDGSVKVQCGTEHFVFDRVIVACGSKASPKTGSDGSGYQLLRSLRCGCRIEEVVPALVQLRCKEQYLKSVAGVRAEGRVTLYLDGVESAVETGEIQLTDYGVSGIPVFQISRYASYGCLRGQKAEVHLDFMPYMDTADFVEYMCNRRVKLADRTVERFCTGLLNKKLCMLFIKLAGLSPEQTVQYVSEKQFIQFIHLFKNWCITVDRPNGFDMAQVCAGGLSMAEVDRHFAMKKCPSVYVVGELLDVDGMCGGYNLQWAWTSGYIAGQHAAREEGTETV